MPYKWYIRNSSCDVVKYMNEGHTYTHTQSGFCHTHVSRHRVSGCNHTCTVNVFHTARQNVYGSERTGITELHQASQVATS